MASQTQGIQQLLAAEKKAAEKVAEARKRKQSQSNSNWIQIQKQKTYVFFAIDDVTRVEKSHD